MASRKRYIIDSTPHSAVVRCTRCSWRGFSHSKPSAYRQIADHLVHCHDDSDAARDARTLARRHHRSLSSATTATTE